MKIHEYPLEQLTFQDESYYDIDFWTGVGYESKKILGSVIRQGIIDGIVANFKLAPIAQFHVNDFYGAGNANWNGVANISTPSQITLNQRYTLSEFTKLGTRKGFYVQFQIPTYFRLDLSAQFKISVVWTTQNIGGDVYWNIGLTRPTLANSFGVDLSTQWIEVAEPVVGGFQIQKMDFIFDSTDMSIEDPLTLLMFRENNNILDTFSDDAYINSISIEQI